jgi:hypothetical protein
MMDDRGKMISDHFIRSIGSLKQVFLFLPGRDGHVHDRRDVKGRRRGGKLGVIGHDMYLRITENRVSIFSKFTLSLPPLISSLFSVLLPYFFGLPDLAGGAPANHDVQRGGREEEERDALGALSTITFS